VPFWKTGNGPRTIVWQNKFVKLKIIIILHIGFIWGSEKSYLKKEINSSKNKNLKYFN